MANREELYKKFGPMLIETIVLIIMDEINALRTDLELPERTITQLENAITNRLVGLEKYNWMD